MKISKKLKLYELETIETIPKNFRNKVTIPVTYIPIAHKSHDTTKYWTWRAFMGERFIGEYTPWWYGKLQQPLPYLKRPKLSMLFDTNLVALYRQGIDDKKIARALNVLEFGSTRYGVTRLIKCINTHCGINARDISHSKGR